VRLECRIEAVERRDERYLKLHREPERRDAFDTEMRMNQRRAASPQQTQIGHLIACEHLPADARELPPFVQVLQCEGACPIGREAETFPAHVKRSVPAQMLRLLGNEGL